jgi:hypothetical protein
MKSLHRVGKMREKRIPAGGDAAGTPSRAI